MAASPRLRAIPFAVVLGIVCGVLFWGIAPASAAEKLGEARAEAMTDEVELAERYAPRVRLTRQSDACAAGGPYRPSDVDRLFGDSSVALRGPWQQADLISVGPTAEQLSAGLPRYALDYPGNPLKPGCDYEEWAQETWAGSPTTVYAHLATEESEPGWLALQFWFYFPYNDFNNKHEGDWEMIQLEFEATDPAAALETEPATVVYAGHEGGERSAWEGGTVQVEDGTHPVVYVSAGSHASHFDSGLFLLRSSTQGFGCDSTLDPGVPEAPVVRTIPADDAAATEAFPWIDYEGLWGQRESVGIFSGPTGPGTKDQWTEPFTWSAGAEDRSYAVPGGEVYGVKTTDFFCGVVEQGSLLFLQITANPWPVLGGLAVAVLLVVWLVRRTAWGTSRPIPVRAERGFGETVAVSWSLFRSRWRLFLGIGSVVALVSLATGLLTQLASGSLTGSVGAVEGDSSVALAIAPGLSALLLAISLVLAQAATVHALGRIASGEPVTVAGAYGLALAHAAPLIGTGLLALASIGVLLLTIFLAPLALLVGCAWALYVPVTQLEERAGRAALRRSWRLVRPQFLKVAALLAFSALLTALVGGIAGVLPLLVAQVPFLVVNLIPGVVAALLGPFTSLLLGYTYFHGVAAEAQPEEKAALSAS